MNTITSDGYDHITCTAMIVDDEEDSIVNLSTLLATYCPHINVIGHAVSAELAFEMLSEKEPDILFLDVRMPGANGFDLLDSLDSYTFTVIFVTAYDQYALRAIKACAVDYILKPISPKELQEAVARGVEDRHKRTQPEFATLYKSIMHQLIHSIQYGDPITQIALPTSDGLILQKINEIIRLEAHGSYTTIVQNEGKRVVLSKPLKEFESLLDEDQFLRVHNSHMVNIRYIRKYDKHDGGYAVMSDDKRIPISRRRTRKFLEWLHKRIKHV